MSRTKNLPYNEGTGKRLARYRTLLFAEFAGYSRLAATGSGGRVAQLAQPSLRRGLGVSVEQQARVDHAFFRRDAETVARDLLGTILVRRYRGRHLRARIVETEAYVGPHDLACHASKGRTARTQTMFLPGGVAYVYFIYGMYDMLNVVTGVKDDAQAVLIRAAEPLDGWRERPDLSGPGKLTRGMHITRADNGADLMSDALHFLPRAAGDVPAIGATPRIGVDYAGTWKDALLRFVDRGSKAVSRARFARQPGR